MGKARSPGVAPAPLAVLLLAALVLFLLVRRRLRRAAARREEVRRLARLAAEEAELAEREAAFAYYAELAAAAAPPPPGTTAWDRTPASAQVMAPAPATMAATATATAPVPKGVCAVCFAPTTRRCKQCKAVKYCSFKCQIVHWRQGHKEECHPPSIDPKSDGGMKDSDPKKEKVEEFNVSDNNLVDGVEPIAEASKSVPTRPEYSGSNHLVENLDITDKSKDMPLKDRTNTMEAFEDTCADKAWPSHSSGLVESVIADGSKSRRATVHSGVAHLAKPVDNVSHSKYLNDIGSSSKAEVSEHKQSAHLSSTSDESVDHSRTGSRENVGKVQDAVGGERFSQIAQNEKSMDDSKSQDTRPVELDAKSSRIKDSSCVISSPEGRSHLMHLETKASGINSLKSTKHSPSTSSADKISSIRGGHAVMTDVRKKADITAEFPVRSSGSASATSNGLATSLKRNVSQHTTTKLVRHYQSEMMLFPYDLFVKLYNFDKVELHPFGLVNLGNSCYANAVLQCLTFTRPLTAYLLEGIHSKNCSKKEWCFVCEFENLVQKGRLNKSSLSPTGILSHLHDIGSNFGLGKEEDAHEFLRYVIDTMQSVCIKEARQNGADRLVEETTLVQLIFGGYLRSKIKCTRCQGSSEQYERILDLTVEIDGDIGTLEEALQRFTSTEVLDGENKYQCGRCNSYQRAKKKLTISEAPNVLTIALKRYQSGKFGKISKAVRFPEILNLAHYMNGTDDKSPVYRLYAVVVHRDIMNAAFSGHYICYVKDTQGKWYKINDSQVKPVSLEKVLSKCAYMLLYARCSPRAPSSVRKVISLDLVRPKKPRNKAMEASGSANMQGGSSGRHRGGRFRTDGMMDGPTIALLVDPCGDRLYQAESPSPSDSSSLFSNSDVGSFSTDSTDSTRNSTSTEECDSIFGHSDQMNIAGSPVRLSDDNECIAYSQWSSSSRWSSGLNPSFSGREVDQEGQKPPGSRGGWFEGHESPSFLYTDQSQSKQQCSESIEQSRKVEETDWVHHGPEDGRGGVLLRRPTRERTAQTFY